MELPDLLQGLRAAAAACSAGIFLVGGCVRDGLLGRPLADIDLAVEGDCEGVSAALAGKLGATRFPLGRFGATRVLAPAPDGAVRTIDLSPCHGTIAQDLARRDLTINAMAVALEGFAGDWTTAVVLDPCGGRADLSRRTIRMVQAANFAADPVRVLRAVRLAAELDFVLDPATRAAIAGHAPRLGAVAPERVKDELVRLLAATGSAPWLAECETLGVLFILFPELEAGRGVEQPREHYWDVLTHQVEAVAAADALGGFAPPAAPAHLQLVRDNRPAGAAGLLGEPATRSAEQRARLVRLKLAALLHDVAKPATRSVQPDGRMRFFGHSELGAAMTVAALRRLRFPHGDVQAVGAQVRHHLRPTQMAASGLPSDRAVHRYFRDLGEVAAGTLLLSLADHAAARGPLLQPSGWTRHVELVDYCLERHAHQRRLAGPARLVTGRDLIALGSPPGPRFAVVLAEIEDARAGGAIATRAEALDLARALLARTGAAA